MAPPAGTLRVWRYFAALLALIAVLYLIVFWPGTRHTPKLGLDLRGGTQVIFTAKTDNGETPSSSEMQQAKQIMTNRVNGSGVTEATVVIQGNNQLVVSIPGSTNTNIAQLGAAAQLNFRGLVAPAVYVNCTPPSSSPSTSPSSSASPGASSSASPAASATPTASGTGATIAPKSAHEAPLAKSTPSSSPKAAATPSSTPKATGTAAASNTPSTTPSPSASTTAPPPACVSSPLASIAKSGSITIPTTETAWDALDSTKQSAIQQALATFNCASAQDEVDNPKSYYVACDSTGSIVYLLGPVIVPGKQISSAQAQAPDFQNGTSQWTVVLNLKSSGSAAWAKYTSAHNINNSDSSTADVTACGTAAGGYPCADFVAFTLDGQVISSPVNETAINSPQTEISGSFTQKSANELADQLKYGALPLNFTAQQAEQVSATLGTSQLKSGLLAGGIGLILVVLYSLIYYRALGLVTIASLIVSGILVYGSLVMLGTQMNFTLSLAGIAGFIVAVGITADSFVVFFERMKDEVHEGRSARVAVPRAWIRARRTILSADTVSFLAAAILYYFAAGDVRGFAFTLGLSTLLDVIVVFLFTHPLISVLSRSRAFGSARFTGLDAVRVAGAGFAAAPINVYTPAPSAEPDADGVGADTVESDAVADYDDVPDAGNEPVDEASAGVEGDQPASRGQTTPGQTAAERAAARRARMREQQKGGQS